MSRLSRTKLYAKVIEYTSIPLLIGFYLIYLSGKGLVKVELVKAMTFGLIGYSGSISLHVSSLLNYLVGLLVVLHSVSGLGLLINRKVRDRSIKVWLEIIVFVLVGLMLTIQLTILEFL
ncbi:MAG: hypothetical protein ACUVQ8_04320 [Nitrososphaeria archaeon]